MIYNIYFSPTGSTQKVTSFLANQINTCTDVDLSLPKNNFSINIGKDDFCIVGVPSFGGRVPDIAIKRLSQLKGHQTPVLAVVTYGNRAYEDTLLELKETLEQQGFLCIAAIACVAEHSIMHQFAKGRPNQDDLNEMAGFMEEVKKRLKKQAISVYVPGNNPYKEYHVIPLHPKASSTCHQCGLCARRCPVQAIPLDNPQEIIKGQCISCMRCVHICPQQARKCSSIKIKMASQKLQKQCMVKKENEFF